MIGSEPSQKRRTESAERVKVRETLSRGCFWVRDFNEPSIRVLMSRIQALGIQVVTLFLAIGYAMFLAHSEVHTTCHTQGRLNHPLFCLFKEQISIFL